AGLDKAAGLLGAPARIRPVDEPALVVHEVMEVAPGPGQALAKVLATDLEELGADRVRHLEDSAEDLDQALLTFDAEQHAARARDPGFLDQRVHVGPHAALV